MHTITEKEEGAVFINGTPYQIGTLLCVRVRPTLYRITTRENTRNRLIEANYNQVIDPRTGVAFSSMDALEAFTLANCYLTDGAGTGNIRTYVEQMPGSPDGNYTLTYIPIVNTITVEVNGVGGTVIYSGSGKSTTVNADFDIDEADILKFTYNYNEADN